MCANTIEGSLDAAGKRFAIVAAKWNNEISEHLLQGALETIVRHGGENENITVVRVPGSFEIPLVCRELALSKTFDAIVALGCLLKGETDHFQLVASEVASGLRAVMEETGVPVAFGVIASDSIQKARERAGGKVGNKGNEAAMAAIEMASLLPELKKLADR